VLQNIAKLLQQPDPDEEVLPEEIEEAHNNDGNPNIAGNAERQRLIEEYFSI